MNIAAAKAARPNKRAAIAKDTALAQHLLNHVQRSASSNTARCLALAGEKLSQLSAEAVDLYTDVAREHDLRDAWLGLACAHHLRGDSVRAAETIGRTLRHHAFDRDVAPLVQVIAKTIDAAGWCALDGRDRKSVV